MLDKRVARVFRVHLTCDHCKDGELLPTGKAELTNPPRYIHECGHCGHQESHRVRYPATAYEEIHASATGNESV